MKRVTAIAVIIVTTIAVMLHHTTGKETIVPLIIISNLLLPVYTKATHNGVELEWLQTTVVQV
jgi:hypothetical protein